MNGEEGQTSTGVHVCAQHTEKRKLLASLVSQYVMQIMGRNLGTSLGTTRLPPGPSRGSEIQPHAFAR